VIVQTIFKLLITIKGLILYFAPRRKARNLHLMTKEVMPRYVRDDKGKKYYREQIEGAPPIQHQSFKRP
jgi:hypothetical protein